MSDKAVGSGKVTAAEVAQKVFDAAAQGQFYIYSHPQALASVQTRMEDVLQILQPHRPLCWQARIGCQAARGFAQRRLSTGSAGRVLKSNRPLAPEI